MSLIETLQIDVTARPDAKYFRKQPKKKIPDFCAEFDTFHLFHAVVPSLTLTFCNKAKLAYIHYTLKAKTRLLYAVSLDLISLTNTVRDRDP